MRAEPSRYMKKIFPINCLQVEEFDPWLFVPSYLYVSRWKSAQDRLFPSKGERVYIFLAGEDRLDWRKLDHLVTNLENQTDILTQVDSWFIHFKEYWEYNFRTDEGDWNKTEPFKCTISK